MTFLYRLRRCAVTLFIAAYLGTIGWYFVLHLLGDSGHDPLSYFWTWDMYPDYRTESTRRIVIAETEGGEFIQIIPGPTDRFRWGAHGDATRIDIDRRLPLLHEQTRQALEQHESPRAASRGFRHVYIVERYWPAKFNLTDPLYESVYDEPHPHRSYWRIVDEATVDADGVPQWVSQ